MFRAESGANQRLDSQGLIKTQSLGQAPRLDTEGRKGRSRYLGPEQRRGQAGRRMSKKPEQIRSQELRSRSKSLVQTRGRELSSRSNHRFQTKSQELRSRSKSPVQTRGRDLNSRSNHRFQTKSQELRSSSKSLVQTKSREDLQKYRISDSQNRVFDKFLAEDRSGRPSVDHGRHRVGQYVIYKGDGASRPSKESVKQTMAQESTLRLSKIKTVLNNPKLSRDDKVSVINRIFNSEVLKPGTLSDATSTNSALSRADKSTVLLKHFDQSMYGRPNVKLVDPTTIFVNIGGDVKHTEGFAMQKFDKESKEKFTNIKTVLNDPNLSRKEKVDQINLIFEANVLEPMRESETLKNNNLTPEQKTKVFKKMFDHFVPRVKVGYISGELANKILSASVPEKLGTPQESLRPYWSPKILPKGPPGEAAPINVDINSAHNQIGVSGRLMQELDEQLRQNGGVKIHTFNPNPFLP